MSKVRVSVLISSEESYLVDKSYNWVWDELCALICRIDWKMLRS